MFQNSRPSSGFNVSKLCLISRKKYYCWFICWLIYRLFVLSIKCKKIMKIVDVVCRSVFPNLSSNVLSTTPPLNVYWLIVPQLAVAPVSFYNHGNLTAIALADKNYISMTSLVLNGVILQYLVFLALLQHPTSFLVILLGLEQTNTFIINNLLIT